MCLRSNEIWVTLNHQEQRLGGIEGQTVSHSIDIRATELVLVERTGDQDLIYALQDNLEQEVVHLWHKDRDIGLFQQRRSPF